MNRRAIATNAVLALAYGATGTATLMLGQAIGPDLGSVLWIGSGIALAVALLVPFPVWPGVALGAMLTTVSQGNPAVHVLATGVANGGEIALAMWLLTNADFNRRFGTVRDVARFVGLACGVSAALAAVVSVTSLIATGGAPASAFGRIWAMWWLTHAMGMLVVVPVTLIFRSRGSELAQAGRGEALMLLTAAAVGAWISFTAPANSLRAELFFLPFPLLLMAAVRGDAFIATVGGLVVTLLAIAGLLGLRGPFAQGTPNEALFLTWSFATVTIVATVITTATVRARTLAQQEVYRGERRLRAVLEATSEGVLVADDLGRVTDVNTAFFRMVGADGQARLDRHAEVSTFLAPLRPIGPDGRPELPPVLDADIAPDRLETAELHLDGGRVLEAESFPLQGATDLPGRVWSFRDVTERVQAEDERRRLHEQILHSQKLEGLGVLAGGVAHDFNNVLAGIVGYGELLLTNPGLDEEGRSDAEGIIKAAQHAAGLCGQLLTYAGKTTAVLAPVELSACAGEMRELMALSVSKSVELALELPSTPLLTHADEVQLRQVIFNLVANASEAVRARGGPGSVIVRVGTRYCDRGWLDRAYAADGLHPGEYAVIEVEDNGIGMSPDEVSQIFDPFYSSKGAGRGLGLSAVLGVLRSHQGALTLETEVGLGTRFQVALPLADRPALPVAQPAPRRDAMGGPATILVVDDEAAVRGAVARMIQGEGYEVVQAGDGEEALEILSARHEDIDLILLDLTMPRRDGLSTLAEMRERGYRIPVLLASGYSAEAVPFDAAVAGFIQKPFRSAELRERVASVLSHGRAGVA